MMNSFSGAKPVLPFYRALPSSCRLCATEGLPITGTNRIFCPPCVAAHLLRPTVHAVIGPTRSKNTWNGIWTDTKRGPRLSGEGDDYRAWAEVRSRYERTSVSEIVLQTVRPAGTVRRQSRLRASVKEPHRRPLSRRRTELLPGADLQWQVKTAQGGLGHSRSGSAGWV